ncbi:cholesterol esterase, partial [Lentilactobacillus parakefiri]
MGRISIPKFAVALTAGLAAFGVTGFAVAQGGLTANLALSGTFFKVSMSHLE